MKALVCGDRYWNDIETIVEVLEKLPSGSIIVHGACHLGGADIIAGEVAKQLGFEVREYPADWIAFKKGAGPIRNQQMLNSEHKVDEPIDVCLAFHEDLSKSRGTKDMVRRALAAHIKVIVFTKVQR